MIPDGKEIGYECRNGHVHEKHKAVPTGHDGHRAACIECGERLVRTLIPLLECQDCGNVWPYTGDADRPTCSDCRGKRTVRLSDGDD